jgi:hypothetical protein
MGKNMWQEMGPNNGAPRGSEGEKFWVSEKNDPVSFQPQSNIKNKNIKIAELSREPHLVQMTTQASFFADQENNKHFYPRMRLKDSLNIRGITAAATQELIKN